MSPYRAIMTTDMIASASHGLSNRGMLPSWPDESIWRTKSYHNPRASMAYPSVVLVRSLHTHTLRWPAALGGALRRPHSLGVTGLYSSFDPM